MSLLKKYRSWNKRKVENALSNPIQKNHFQNWTETYFCIRPKASMTVEAAVVLPLFVGFMVFLMFYFRIMQVQIGMEQAMAYTARITAASVKEESKKIEPLKVRSLLYARIKKEDVPTEYIDGGIAGISLSEADYKNTDIQLCVRYRMTVPVSFFGRLTYPIRQEVSSRKWTGRVKDSQAEEDGYVYVTKTGKAYHKKKDCAYLDLSIHKESVSLAKKKRNKNGSRYKACPFCYKKGQTSCYITDYGAYYHGKIDCHGLKRTIYMIPIRDVGNRHKCKKCTGG